MRRLAARIRAVMAAEEAIGLLVKRVDQFRPQLVQGHIGGVVEPGGHSDGAHDGAVDLEPWANDQPGFGWLRAGDTGESGFGAADQRLQSGVERCALGVLPEPVQSGAWRAGRLGGRRADLAQRPAPGS